MQGVGGAALFATALALIGAEYTGPERAGAIAVWGSTVGLAVASGPLLGGIITDSLELALGLLRERPRRRFRVRVALRKVRESRDPGARAPTSPGSSRSRAALFLIVQALLRGNDAGWTSAQILGSLVAGVALLAAFVVIEVRQEPSDARRVAVPPAGFRRRPGSRRSRIGAGMFALFPFLSIYLQDILGYSPLGAGLRFLPITVFVFFVPLATRKLSARVPMWALLSASLAIVALGALLMADISPGLELAGAASRASSSPGIGIGLANPTIAGGRAARRRPGAHGHGVRDQQHRAGIGGLAMGVAVLGAVLQVRVGITSRRRAITARSSRPR